jgi:hypothetical protein
MGLKDKLTTTGSPFSAANGGTIATNPLATKLSALHADPTGISGYSLDGTGAIVINAQTAQYNDGIPGANLPPPALLDDVSNNPDNANHTYWNNKPD